LFEQFSLRFFSHNDLIGIPAGVITQYLVIQTFWKMTHIFHKDLHPDLLSGQYISLSILPGQNPFYQKLPQNTNQPVHSCLKIFSHSSSFPAPFLENQGGKQEERKGFHFYKTRYHITRLLLFIYR